MFRWRMSVFKALLNVLGIIPFVVLHGLYSSSNIITVIKARRLMWAGHAARRGEGRCVNRV
jgi:hypothetical protein